jgi:hypothetical protein
VQGDGSKLNSGNTYANKYSHEDLFQEMSKREIKKWKKRQALK